MKPTNVLSQHRLPQQFMYNVISTEALSVHKPLAGTVTKLSGFIREVADGFKNTDILGALDTILHRDRAQSTIQQKAAQFVQRNSYADLMPLSLPCISGLNTTWLKFLTDLEGGINFAINFYDGTLGQSTKFLAEVITSPDKMDSIARRYNIQAIDFEQLTKTIASNVNGKSNKADLPYGKLVERNTDFQSVIALTNRFTEELYSSNQDLVTERIAHIRKQLQQISEGIVDSNTPYRMNGKNIDQLAKISYNLAQAVEYYGLVLSLFTEHKRTFDQACTKLAKQ